MGIVGVTLANETAKAELTGRGYTLTYRVYCDAVTRPSQVLLGLSWAGSPTLPVLGEVHEYDAGVIVKGVDVQVVEGDPTVFDYVVNYGTADVIAFDVDPTARPAEIRWGGTDTTEPVTVDRDGLPIANSRGELFDTPPERECGDGFVEIVRNEADNNAALWNSYSYSVNSDAWYGLLGGQCKLGRITATKKQENSYTYWEVTYPISFNETGWRFKTYDVASVEYEVVKDEDGDPILDDDGNQKTQPVQILDRNGLPSVHLLDGAGNTLFDQGGTPVVYPEDGFKLYKEQSWAALSLPNPFS